MHPKVSIFAQDENPNLKETDLNLEINEIAVAAVLASSIKLNLRADSYLMTFDPRELQKKFSGHESLETIDVEQAIGSLWHKTRNFLNINLELHGLSDTLKEEKEYQLLAVANMWDSVFKNYATHTLEECKQLPFYTIFTNRQAQILLKLT